jgi:hypothetical protein
MVQMMSAHASKGLEFDTVYLGGIYTNGKEMNDGGLFGEFPASFKWYMDLSQRDKRDSPFYLYENELAQYKNFSESKRLFYVACTRAKKKLIWVDLELPEGSFSIPGNSWIDGLKTWLNQEAMAECKDSLVFTEMDSETAIHYVGKFSPDDIIFIEPGTPEFFGKMLEIRTRLIQNGWHVLFPCPKESECPMRGTTDWCHQFIHVSHDPEVERLSQIMRLDRKLLPLTVQIFSRREYHQSAERLVRVMPETKFSFEWQVCRENNLENYQVMKRGMDKATEKKMGNMLAGSSLSTELEKDISGKKRVKLR